ncbi:MAG: magnesium transporter CorA family protein, partial [Patescibacteria group bacterium]
MKTLLHIREGKLSVAPKEEATIRLYSAPDDAERTELVESLGIDPYDVDSALDPDEISRVEINPKHISIIWKVPYKGVQDDSGFDVP